jgi:hypothetical protein
MHLTNSKQTGVKMKILSSNLTCKPEVKDSSILLSHNINIAKPQSELIGTAFFL